MKKKIIPFAVAGVALLGAAALKAAVDIRIADINARKIEEVKFDALSDEQQFAYVQKGLLKVRCDTEFRDRPYYPILENVDAYKRAKARWCYADFGV